MTPDEQEALSFRYVAPRVFVLSSGNIAVCPMIGRAPVRIYTPNEFSISCLHTVDELEMVNRAALDDQRARAETLNRRPAPPKATLDDLA